MSSSGYNFYTKLVRHFYTSRIMNSPKKNLQNNLYNNNDKNDKIFKRPNTSRLFNNNILLDNKIKTFKNKHENSLIHNNNKKYINSYKYKNSKNLHKNINNNNKSNNLTNNFFDISIIKNSMIKSDLYKKYNLNSQIVNLPGSNKRNDKEINDNINFFQNHQKITSFNQKINQDFKSKVLCLPNSLTKNDYFEKRLLNKKFIDPKKFNSSDIFNLMRINHLKNKKGVKFNNIYQKNKESNLSYDMYTRNMINGRKKYYKNYSHFI